MISVPTRTLRHGRPRLAAVIALGALGALAASCAADPNAPPPMRTAVDEGRTIAQTECSSCHAVREVGSSPRADAPPLRTVLDRYSSTMLEIDFLEGMRVGHSDMPSFRFSEDRVDALLAYLRDIRE
ncbi:MAG: cytochrome c [Maricaulaceae bacterium]|jgi:mono/diheme cytochrome c family protein